MTDPQRCQANSAILVKGNMPLSGSDPRTELVLLLSFPAVRTRLFCSGGVDNPNISAIIFLTRWTVPPHALFPTPSGQGPSASPAKPAPSASGDGHRSLVSPRPVLRPAGQFAGQIRDAPSCLRRPSLGHRGGCRLWLFASFVLSSADRLYAIRPARSGATQARPPRRTQVDSRDHGLRPARACRLPSPYRRPVNTPSASRVWRPGASTQPAASTGATRKKTTLASGPAASVGNQDFVRPYEQLRERVLLKDTSGPGSALLCEYGLKTWIDSGPCRLGDRVPRPSFPESLSRALSPPPTQAEMLTLLTTMLFHIPLSEILP
jgi:hypothetical protein